jgi:competence ComEA-like helix-hairpin-helix protein
VFQKTRAVIPPHVTTNAVKFEAASPDKSDRRPGAVTEEMLVKYKININTATEDSLVLLPGIGEHLAGRIVDYRQEHGSFESVDALESVSGIGPVKLKRLKNMITIGNR